MGSSLPSAAELRQRFGDLHSTGTFVMPNPWDVGSARVLAGLGFPALATTSSGFAASLGKADQHVTFDELARHAADLAAAVSVPLNVDSERLFAETPAGVAANVDALAATGISGCSIEDYDPATGAIDLLPVAAERVAAAAEAAGRHGIVLTARAENYLYGMGDLGDTIARLCAYRDAGAAVVYAPGLIDLGDIAAVVKAVTVPVNVLALARGPSVGELAAVGVRRVSIGGSLARACYSALVAGAKELLASGTSGYLAGSSSWSELGTLFAAGRRVA